MDGWMDGGGLWQQRDEIPCEIERARGKKRIYHVLRCQAILEVLTLRHPESD